MEILLDGILLRTLSRTHLVRPAALDRDAVVRGGQSCQQALAAVDADHLQAFAGQAAGVEVVEEALPFGGALGPRQAVVDDLLPAVGTQAEDYQHRAGRRRRSCG